MPSISEPAQTLAPPGAVALDGVLGDALAANHLGRLSHFITDETSPAIAIFAPETVAANEGGDWYGEHAGKWLAAASRAAARSSDTALLGRVRRVADWLIARQGRDGYLGNYPPPRRFTTRHPEKPVSWNGEPSLRTWDIWTHAYLTLGLVELWRVTGEGIYLDAARRIGDLVWRALTEDGLNITDMGNHFGLSATVMLDPALELYFASGEQRYLDLALKIVAQAEGRLGAGLGRLQLAAGGVGGDPLARAAEEGRDRQVRHLADDVPERRLERPEAVGVEVDRLDRPDLVRDPQRVLADEVGLVGTLDVQRMAVGLGEYRHRANAHLGAGTHDAYGDFPSVGDQQLLDHAVFPRIDDQAARAGPVGTRRSVFSPYAEGSDQRK